MDIEDPEVSFARYHDRYMAALRGQLKPDGWRERPGLCGNQRSRVRPYRRQTGSWRKRTGK